jgi:hypothetical protein
LLTKCWWNNVDELFTKLMKCAQILDEICVNSWWNFDQIMLNCWQNHDVLLMKCQWKVLKNANNIMINCWLNANVKMINCWQCLDKLLMECWWCKNVKFELTKNIDKSTTKVETDLRILNVGLAIQNILRL